MQLPLGNLFLGGPTCRTGCSAAYNRHMDGGAKEVHVAAMSSVMSRNGNLQPLRLATNIRI